MMFKASPREIFDGSRLTLGGDCVITCSATGQQLREGDRVRVHVQRHRIGKGWTQVAVYAHDAVPEGALENPPGWDELLLDGRLAVASDAAAQDAWLALHDVSVIQANRADADE